MKKKKTNTENDRNSPPSLSEEASSAHQALVVGLASKEKMVTFGDFVALFLWLDWIFVGVFCVF